MSDEPNKTVIETIDGQPIDHDPVKQFQRWFEEAKAAGLPLPEAMTLATATPEGRPSARMVLLKQLDERGFVFFTNYRSAKAHELDINPYASLVFFWPQLERQVRIDGRVIRTSAEESRQYFETRPRESQIGAWASNQSEVISGREVLDQRKAELENYYLDRAVEWPTHWGGYILRPDRIEFWKGRIGRLHDRILYERELGNTWIIKRLAP
jgi:pyridoxamine 5'-phosphate oxidase